MEQRVTDLRRREFVALATGGVVTGLAGCGGGDAASPTATPTETVPDPYRTATSLNGQQRDPDSLSAKPALNYQSQPSEGEQCSGCAFYVPDRNGDGLGACTLVAGSIDPEGWCASYSPHEEATPAATTGSASEPASVPADATCPVCEMKPAEYPDWNAQLVHGDGTRAHFDTCGCMLAYYVLPGEFAGTDASIDALWVTDYETRDLIDGREAHYALETDADRVDDPMGLNPAPFEDRADAEAYVDAVDHLTDEDIAGIEAFDRDLATRYRGGLIED